MNCETAAELLPELLSGALDGEREQEALAHLARCAACRKELAFWAQMRQAVLEIAEEAPEETIENVRENLFGSRAATVMESLRITGRALGLAGSAFRLALAAAGSR